MVKIAAVKAVTFTSQPRLMGIINIVYAMRHIIIWLFLLALPFMVLAQKEVLRGTVKDDSGDPVALAVILTVRPQDSSVVAHTVTDAEGNFRVAGNFAGRYWVQAHQMGYITTSTEVELPTVVPVVLVLKNDPKEIEAVRVGARRGGMQRKGDTVGYNLKAYATGMEKTLGDVLSNLPGIKVAPDGQVTAQGKPVSKILFNGRDYYGNNVAMATKNIDASVADTVKVIQGYSEFDILRGFQNVDKTVIDVGVKDGMLNKLFGKIEAGGGYRNAYMGNLKATYMGTNHMFTALVASNNVAEETFTIMDYLAMQGGLQSPDGGFQVRIELEDGLSDIIYPPEDTYQANTHAANLLYNYHKQDRLKVTLAALVAKADNDAKSETLRTFRLGDQEGTSFTTGSEKHSDVAHALANVGVTYNPVKEWMLQAGANVDMGHNKEEAVYHDYYNSQLYHTQQIQEGRPLKWNAKGGVYYRPGEHLYYASGNVSSSRKKPTLDFDTNDPILPLTLTPEQGRYLFRFLMSNEQMTAQSEVGMRLKLTKSQDVKFWLSDQNAGTRFNSWFEGNNIGVRPGFDGELNTDLRYTQSIITAGAHWRFDDDSLWRAGVKLEGRYILQDSKQPQWSYTDRGFYVVPDAFVERRLGDGVELGVNASLYLNGQEGDKLLRYGMQADNYRSVLQNHGYHYLAEYDYDMRVYFRMFPSEKTYHGRTQLAYFKDHGPLSRNLQYGLLTLDMPFALQGDEKVRWNFMVANRFAGVWTLSLRGALFAGRVDLLYDDMWQKSTRNSQDLSFEVRSTYPGHFNVEAEVSGDRSAYKVGARPYSVDYELSARAKFLFEWEAFRAEVGSAYALNAYSERRRDLVGLDTEFSYTFPHNVSLVLAGKNLLNLHLREWTDVSYSDLFRSERLYRSMPGYVLAKVRWEFGQKRDSMRGLRVIRQKR